MAPIGSNSGRRAALLLGLLLTGCATLGLEGVGAPRFSSADGNGSRLRLLAPGPGHPLGAASVRMWTRVENPNPVRITVSELVGTVYLEDAPIEAGFPLGLPLEPHGEAVVPLDVTVGLGDVPRLAEVAGRAVLSGDPVPYRLEGTIGVDAGPLGTPRFGPMTVLRGELRPAR